VKFIAVILSVLCLVSNKCYDYSLFVIITKSAYLKALQHLTYAVLKLQIPVYIRLQDITPRS